MVIALVRKAAACAVVSCFGLLIGLAIAEVAVRLSRLGSAAPQWNDRPAFYFAAPGPRPHQDFDYPDLKPEGAFRIAVVGDSYTFAPYMQFTDTFVKKLETMLNLNEGGRKAEVINYGVPAYSTSHEIGVVQAALKRRADLVLLQITLNDPELKPLRPTGIRADAFDRFGELQPQGWQKTVLHYWKTADLVARRLHNNATHRAYADYFNELYEKRRSWAVFKDSLAQIASSCRKAGVPLAAVIFPLFGLPLDSEYPFHGIHQKTAGLLSELGVPYLDLYKTYEGIPLERLQVVPGKDRHPNEIAHRMAAEAIYVWLARENHVPADLRISRAYAIRLGIANQPPYHDASIGR